MTNFFCTSCGTEYRRIGQEFCAMCGTPSDPQGLAAENEFDPHVHQFSPQKIDGYGEGVFSFHNANLEIVIGSSERWFDGNESYFTDGEDFFGSFESILWEDSKFGQRFISLLEAAGAHISHGYYGRTAVFDREDGTQEVVPLSNPIDLYSGIWSLSDGSPFIQKGQVFKSKEDGREIVFWNIDALVNSRYSLTSIEKSASHQLHIPHLLQVATYLAETPFPSPLAGSFGMFQRKDSFGEDNQNPPRPVTRFQRDGIALNLVRSNGQNQAIGLWAPELYQHGYVFTDSMTDEEISSAIPAVCDGLPRILEILVDGYANWPEDSELNFQLSLGSGSSQCEDEEFYKYGLYVPGQVYGALCSHSTERYNQIYVRQEALKENGKFDEFIVGLSDFKYLADFGMGSISCHSANTYSFNAISMSLELNPEEMLKYFKDIDVDSQGTNAISNLILYYVKHKKFKAADSLIDEALVMSERPGPNLETVSHFHNWDGDFETAIALEILESALTIKEELGDTKGLRKIAERTLGYCEKKSPQSDLVARAEKLLK